MFDIEDYYRLLHADNVNNITIDNIEDSRTGLKHIIDTALLILQEHKENRSGYPNCDAYTLFQMSTLKAISILELSNGCKYSSPNNQLQLTDSYSIYCIIRAIFESLCNFNNIYSQSTSENELMLKYDLWVLSGLNYRQRFSTIVGVNKLKKEAEAHQIAKIKKSIFNNPIFIELDNSDRSKIVKAIKEYKWHIKITDNKISFLQWHHIFKEIVTNATFDQMYTALSLNTLPSNVSVFQFNGLKDEKDDLRNIKSGLMLTKTFMSLFITEYCHYFKDMKSIFQATPSLSQQLINYYNLFRNPSCP